MQHLIEVKRMRQGEADPNAGAGNCYYRGTKIVWALVHDGELTGYYFLTKKLAQEIADHANKINWDGENGDIETSYYNAKQEKTNMDTFSKQERNYLKDHLASGNAKLPATTAVFNFGTAQDCPSKKLNLCTIAKKCYARKAEIQYYKAVPAYRNRQLNLINQTTAEKFAGMFLDINAAKRKPFDTLRINESGDFYTQADVDKMEHIATILADHNVTTYCYSARKDLDFTGCNHMVVNGSNFMGHNQFRAVTEPTGLNFVCPGSCKTCSVCSTKTNKVIEVKIH